jgi:predicted lipoprotein with Yx(FWY)xxD motif/cytochrome c5
MKRSVFNMNWPLKISLSFAVLAFAASGSAQEGEQHHPPQAGQLLYETNCAGCHGEDGSGGSGPALAGSSTLQDAERVINQVLHGGGRMPAFGSVLSDEQIASLTTHIRGSWGNEFGPVNAQQITQQRTGEQAQAADAEAPAATVQVSSSETLDAYLVDGNGRTLYHFFNDAPDGVSRCYDPCTNRWLPFLTGGEAAPGEWLEASSLSTTDREDGTTQVTYKGWPLYYFSGDENPGDALGGDISDVWQVALPDISSVGGGQ